MITLNRGRDLKENSCYSEDSRQELYFLSKKYVNYNGQGVFKKFFRYSQKWIATVMGIGPSRNFSILSKMIETIMGIWGLHENFTSSSKVIETIVKLQYSKHCSGGLGEKFSLLT